MLLDSIPRARTGPPQSPDTPLQALAASITHPWRHRALIGILTRREIAVRYRGSLLGSLWTLETPLLTLAVFTLVFGVVLSAKWPGAAGQGGIGMFALALLAGLLMHTLFGEVLSGAPLLVVGQPNYATKMVFPLETLAWVSLLAALVHMMAGLILLVAFNGLWGTGFDVAELALPLVLVPFAVMLLGLAWLLAALGVYIRDLTQLVGPLVMTVMFLGPVFVPRSAMPAGLQPFLVLNPITVPIEQARRIIFDGHWPDWSQIGAYALCSVLVYALGLSVFNLLKKGFPDVL